MPPRARPAGAAPPTAVARRAQRPLTAEYVEALKNYARLLFEGGLAPKGVTRPEGVAALIEVGRDVGLSPTQSIANIAIINGRPTIYGDAALALVRSSGLMEWIEEGVNTDGPEAVAWCKTKRLNVAEPKVTAFGVADAVQAGLWGKKGPWQEYPERMLMFRARSWHLRDNYGDVLMGLILTEEAQDIEPGPRVVVATQTPPVAPLAMAGQKEDPAPAPKSSADALAAADIYPLPTDDEPTDAQLDRLADLRHAHDTAHGIVDDEAASKAAWLKIIDGVCAGATSALHLTRAQADELIATLAKDHDPFDPPPTGKAPADKTAQAN